ncbi:PREDICTED: mitochondrial phosphate carrier protein 1, mitochondrial isoform X1 [Theobroma cacao]|uniref:Mitochondrial phosphate carrier protein 1, mitochondrial isoform X1 n=1 Tax=Theobroma cacao TaxID=3641 RepID=A0AB32WYL9_THECC|nr:PREDICTED: mitochondrial phosphate carrier protein 1, mitochondrial isoform X1 [Theobroma cacao]
MMGEGEVRVSSGGLGYFGVCAFGGMLSAGTTHLVITPLDVLKVNMQVNPVKYNSIASCFTTLLREQGPSVFWRGWAGKFLGYGAQGGCRFGLYEYFKSLYSNIFGDCNRSIIFFLSSASAEVFANVALCPFEAVKIRVQAQPHFAKGLLDAFPKLYSSGGVFGLFSFLLSSLNISLYFYYSNIFPCCSIGFACSFYRGLLPLWGRNLPFSMVMFSTFEHSVDFMYRNVIQRRKEDCSKPQQLGVTCLAGYASGSIGCLISNPTDNIVASLYYRKADSLKLQAIKKIGLLYLFTRSLRIRIMLVGPVVTLQWLFYDTIKVFSGLPTSGKVSTK